MRAYGSLNDGHKMTIWLVLAEGFERRGGLTMTGVARG